MPARGPQLTLGKLTAETMRQRKVETTIEMLSKHKDDLFQQVRELDGEIDILERRRTAVMGSIDDIKAAIAALDKLLPEEDEEDED